MVLQEEDESKPCLPEFKNWSLHNRNKRLELMKKREDALRRSKQMDKLQDYECNSKEQNPKEKSEEAESQDDPDNKLLTYRSSEEKEP